jgi:two-component system chemotaxis sensor kinase CheA
VRLLTSPYQGPDKSSAKLILAPGFATKEAVTTISGRGVGMDVVARNVEAMKGTLEIASELGHGSTFRLSLPVT